MITEVYGDLLTSKSQVIAHQVNCQGVMGSGIAKQIKREYPEVYNSYVEFVQQQKTLSEHSPKLLGRAQLVPTKDFYVANLFGQNGYGTHKRMTNYEAIYNALDDLHDQMISNNLTSVSFPHKMSCGLAGGDWNIVCTMIDSIFKDMDVTVYNFDALPYGFS